MTDEIRKKAIEKSRELYPEETGIFERWEKRIEIYNAGFWSIPYNFNEIIEFWNTEDPFTRDQRRKTLYSCTALLNDLLTYGHCHKWIMYVMEMGFSPEIYAVMRLLFATDERTEEERLEAAKQHYQSVKFGRTDKSTAESYGVDADTLRKWLNGLPKLTSEEEISVPTTKTEIKAEKIIQKFHPDEYDAYTLIKQNLELYNAGCKAAVKKCVKQYIKWGERFHLLENLRQFNKLIKSNLGNAYIREHFLPSVSSEIKPLFEMFLKSIPDKNEKSEELD